MFFLLFDGFQRNLQILDTLGYVCIWTALRGVWLADAICLRTTISILVWQFGRERVDTNGIKMR